MFQISNVIPEDIQESLEEFFHLNEMFEWNFFRKDKNSPLKLQGSFSTQEEANQAWDNLRVHFSEIPTDFEITEILETDWQNAYKAYLKPWSYHELNWVPVWERDTFETPENTMTLYFDAGMAFGTGAHETTRLCAQRLIHFKESNPNNFKTSTIIDAGCGSGILSLSAYLLGCRNVQGFDIDPEAIRVCEENLTFNGMKSGDVIFNQADIEGGLKNKSADLLLANIQSNILTANATRLLNAFSKNGCLVLCGILVIELESVLEHFKNTANSLGLDIETQSETMGDWADIQITYKSV